MKKSLPSLIPKGANPVPKPSTPNSQSNVQKVQKNIKKRQFVRHLSNLIKPAKSGSSKKDDIAYSKSSGAFELFDQIYALIRKCRTMPERKIIIDDDDANDVTFLPYVLELFNKVTEKNVFEQLPPQIVQELLSFSEVMMFRKKPQIEKKFVLCDTPVTFYLTYPREMEVIHRLYSFILFKNGGEWINEEYVKRFVLLVDSPDEEDQDEISRLILEIGNSLPQFKDIIFNSCMDLIKKYNEGMMFHFCVKTVLEIILELNETESIPDWTRPNLDQLFKLFTSEFLMTFYPRLKEILCSIYCKDPKYMHESFTYLKYHWPYTNSLKQTGYLHHLVLLVAALNQKATRNEIDFLEKTIISSLQSEKLQTSVSAMTIIADPQLYMQLEALKPAIYDTIINALIGLKSKWYSAIQKSDAECIDRLMSFKQTFSSRRSKESDIQDAVDAAQKSSDSNQKLSWEDIKEMASVAM